MPIELIEYLNQFKTHLIKQGFNGSIELHYGNEKITVITIDYVLVPNYYNTQKLINLMKEYEL